MSEKTSKPTSQDNYTIRRMRREEVDLAIEWARANGWNHAVHDAECFWAADPSGFLIGHLDGEPVGCISAVKYGATYGYLGMYLVRPEFRGRGFGLRLWKEAMSSLQGRVVGLDGDMHQVSNYEKSGFRTLYFNWRYRGKARREGVFDDPRILPLSAVPFEQLLEYDRRQLPEPRPEFLRCWIDCYSHLALGAVEGDRLVGYAVGRAFRTSHKIAPLFADDKSVAEALYRAVTRRLPEGRTVELDVPAEEENPEATALARRHQMAPVSQTAHMIFPASADVRPPLHHWYGITNYALG